MGSGRRSADQNNPIAETSVYVPDSGAWRAIEIRPPASARKVALACQRETRNTWVAVTVTVSPGGKPENSICTS
jgi:hypothetical protein